MRRKISKKRTTDQVFETRRAAFRSAKRDHGVPMGKQPDEVVEPEIYKGEKYKLDRRNRKLYIFRILISLFGFKGTDEKEIFIREDKKAIYSKTEQQIEHFNAGEKSSGLKKHYYFKRK